MDFQPLFNLDELVISSNNKSFSPPRSMMISLEEQLSAFGNQTFWFSEGLNLSSIGSLLQDTRMQFSGMADPCNLLPIEPKVCPGPSYSTSSSSFFSQESNNVKIEVLSPPNTPPLDLNLRDFCDRESFSSVNMLMKYVNPTTSEDTFHNSMESCSAEEIDMLDPVHVLDMDMPTSSVSTVASTPEIKNIEVSQVSNCREPVKPVNEKIESIGGETSGNLKLKDDLKRSVKSVLVAAPTVASASKPKPEKQEKYERLDYSSRRLKGPLVCEICDKTFLNNSSLKQHMSFHRPQRPYRCEYAGCEKSYKTRSELNRHVIVHIGQKNYKCLKCEKTFLRKQYLKTHLIRHNEGLTWECNLCAKIFVSEDDLDKHKISYHKRGKRSSHSGSYSSRFALEYLNENEDSLEA